MLVLLLIAAILLTGCIRPKNAVKKMIEYLTGRYDDTFTYYAPFGGNISSTSTQAIFTCEKLPGAKIWAMCWMEGEEYRFHDNYVWYKYESQTKDLFEEITASAFGCEALVDYSIMDMISNDSFTNETTFEEFMASPNSFHTILAVVSYDRPEMSREQIEANLKREIDMHGVVTSGRIYFADSPDNFVSFIDLTWEDMDTLLCAEFRMSGLGQYEKFDWSNVSLKEISADLNGYGNDN